MSARRIDAVVGQGPPGGVDTLAEQARGAAALGYDCIWCSETSKLDAVAFVGHMGALLPGQRFGIGPIPASLRTGPQWAMAVGTLAGFGVEVDVILGAASTVMTKGWHGRSVVTLRRMESIIAATRAAASGEKTDHTDSDLPTVGFRNGLGPVEFSLGMAALGPKMLRLAGAVADRVAVNLTAPRGVERLLALIDEGAAEAGRPRPAVSVWAHSSVDADQSSLDWGRRFLSGYTRAPGYAENLAAQGYDKTIEFAASAGSMAEIRDSISDEMIADILGFGTADEVRARLHRYLDLGCDVSVVPSTAADPGGAATLAALAR